MARFVSSRNPISSKALKRKSISSLTILRSGYEDVRFTRVEGGWKREREDFIGLSPTVVSSAAVAEECNRVMGCKESWARVYQS